MQEFIYYKKGYKYQLSRTYVCQVSVKPEQDIVTDFITLTTQGKLTVLLGYAWDGPSGPAFDTQTFMRASMIHDALYQLMRMGLLPVAFRSDVDYEMKKACMQDHMFVGRVWWVYASVGLFADAAADPSNIRPELVAPKPHTHDNKIT